LEVWLTYSDDDGITWSESKEIPGVVQTSAHGPDCTRNMSYFGINTAVNFAEWVKDLGWSSGVDPFLKWKKELTGDWQFIGLGPPGAITLKGSGRVVVPGYHSYVRGISGGGGQGAGVALPISQLYNNLAYGHNMISDDGGDSWRLGALMDNGHGANEDQLVELRDGSILLNSRSFSTGSSQYRVQSKSVDGGETFSPSRFVYEIPEPFNGCQGSIVSNTNGTLFLSHPNPQENKGIAASVLRLLGGNVNLTGRDHMTLWKSEDDGESYEVAQLIDEGASGYSSLQTDHSGAGHVASEKEALWILYEQSDPLPETFSSLSADALIGALSVLNPDRFVLRLLTP